MRTARAMIKVRSLAQYRARVEAVAREEGLRVVVDRRILRPRLEKGRWLVDCPNCRAGIAIEPDWPEAGCSDPECCRWFTQIEIPTDRHDIEAVLNRRRARRNKNWRPGETVTQLRDENDRNPDAVRGERAEPEDEVIE